jgi:hypothetical protein
MLANNFVIVFADGRVMNKPQALDDTLGNANWA